MSWSSDQGQRGNGLRALPPGTHLGCSPDIQTGFLDLDPRIGHLLVCCPMPRRASEMSLDTSFLVGLSLSKSPLDMTRTQLLLSHKYTCGHNGPGRRPAAKQQLTAFCVALNSGDTCAVGQSQSAPCSLAFGQREPRVSASSTGNGQDSSLKYHGYL